MRHFLCPWESNDFSLRNDWGVIKILHHYRALYYMNVRDVMLHIVSKHRLK